MSGIVDNLPLFLRNYMYDSGWTSLWWIQEQSLDVAFNTNANILISAGTSGGKTEAAFFPVIATIYNERPNGIGAIYVSPLKALIDDQNERLGRILRDSEIRVTGWHGDVDSRRKANVRDNPSGILQITPESLQGLILFHTDDVVRMFGDLRYIIIDEVHAFLGSVRGLQLLCVISSVMRISGCRPRVIGLSATLSDVEHAKGWVSSVNGLSTHVIRDPSHIDHSISVHYTRFPSPDDPSYQRAVEEYYDLLYSETNPYNCIVFANSRLKAEKTSRSLTSYTKYMGSPKRIAIHHGSISREIRKDSEAKLKSSDFKTTLVATTTMELGIDVGDVERVVQLDPPFASSSFVQRMGRSGRRTGHPIMVLFCSDAEGNDYETPLGFSMSLIQSLALINLYERDGWVEPIRHSELPYGLLFQQIMITASVFNSASPERMTEYMHGLYPFRKIPLEDICILIDDMIARDYLHVVPDDGTLVVGDEGSRLMDPRRILAVFEDDNDFSVMFGDKKIGYLPKKPPVGGKILLGGRAWIVKEVERSTVIAVPCGSEAVTRWSSGIPDIHTRVVREMRDVLLGDGAFDCLDQNASDRLRSDRANLKRDLLGRGMFVSQGETMMIYPWLGTVQFDTLSRILGRIEEVSVIDSVPMFRIKLMTRLSPRELYDRIEECRRTVDPMELITKDDNLVIDKFDRYVPDALLRKRFVNERIDLQFILNQPLDKHHTFEFRI